MSRRLHLAILSDIHYAGAAEQQRTNYCLRHIANPVRRLVVKWYRHFVWERDPFAHNRLLDRFVERTRGTDLVVANGDYSCDSAFVGMSDDAAFQSAQECLGKLRRVFDGKCLATVGDHELGKKPLGADLGGLRIASYYRTKKELSVEPFWQFAAGNHLLLGITSTLVALPVYESEALEAERAQWRELRQQHLNEIRGAFASLKPHQRVLLFCHDPTALPFLWREDKVRQKLPQVERTIIGHLHSNLYFKTGRLLSGMPVIGFLGHTPKRLSLALREARHWKPFHPLLCPSLAGIELLKDGGFYTAELDVDAKVSAKFQFQPVPQ